MSFSPRHEEALATSVASLRRVDASSGVDASALASEVAAALHTLLDAVAVMYRPSQTARDWIIGTAGPGTAFLDAAVRATLARTPEYLLYDPVRPALRDRNSLHSAERGEFHEWARGINDRLGSAIGQTRMLVCDGPVLLAWVGILRPPGRDLGLDAYVLRSVAQAVRPRLRLALGVGAALIRSSFEASLEAFPGEAYVVRRNGRVEYANALGAARLAQARSGPAVTLVKAVRRYPLPSPDYELHPLRGLRRAGALPGDAAARGAGPRAKAARRGRPVASHLPTGRGPRASCARRCQQGHRRTRGDQRADGRATRGRNSREREGREPVAPRRTCVVDMTLARSAREASSIVLVRR